MASQLVGSSFADGALLPNYVNGRLLAAEDLATGQSTLLRRDTWVGQAAGPGIVNGLWVTASAATLTVGAGLGITPAGEPVSVPAPVTLQLSIAGAPAAQAGGSFANCTTAPAGSQAAVTAGAYLLTAMPACQLQGQAPMAIPPGSDTPVGCTAQWQAEGVQFKAIPLQFTTQVNGVAEVGGIPVASGNTRNLLAHWCFGTPQLASLGADPFNFNPAYRGLDKLASTDLTPRDLPLCVFFWGAGTTTKPAISFIDNWSVRRRVTRPDVSVASWGAAVADQRSADGEARFLQFQDQILDLVSAGVSRTTVASDVFGLLPPMGVLPVAADVMADDIAGRRQVADEATVFTGQAAATGPAGIVSPDIIDTLLAGLSQLGPQSGFVPSTFFSGMASNFSGLLTWDIFYFALRQSYFLEPITIAQPQSTVPGTSAASVPAGTTPPLTRLMPLFQATPFPLIRPSAALAGRQALQNPQEEIIYYYYVLENQVALSNSLNGTGPPVTPYLVFTSNQFWIAPLPAVTGVSPASGPAAGQTVVTITGTGLANATSVSFGGILGVITADSSMQITAISPPGTGTVDITVTTPAGTSAVNPPADQFTYIAPPAVTRVFPTSGSTTDHTVVTITGTGLADASRVSFGGAFGEIRAASSTQIIVTSPLGQPNTTVDIIVTTPVGTSAVTPADKFTYNAPLQ